MRIHARLPLNRFLTGAWTLEEDDGHILVGPYECYGKADGQHAKDHGNPDRYPTLPFGDHPYGTYVVSRIDKDKPPAHSYGPYFLALTPISGDALKAMQNHRTGLGIHGGDLNEQGHLRPTDGCLRVRNAGLILVAHRIVLGVQYLCEPV